ncbi:hypothetical protein ILYODFUR_035383, partial [Ilyodon furcidens]
MCSAPCRLSSEKKEKEKEACGDAHLQRLTPVRIGGQLNSSRAPPRPHPQRRHYKRRGERRREYYEKIKKDPAQFLQVHGRSYKIHLDPAVALAAESPAN